MRKIITATTFTFLACSITQAQTVQKIGDNPTEINKTAVLEVASTAKGFLPPRMTTVQRDAITTPANGLVIYNTTTKKQEVWDGTIWSSGSDNLGDHTATKDLDMKNKNINNVAEIDLKDEMRIYDQSTVPTGNYVSLWKRDGEFKIWDSATSKNVFYLNEAGKTTLTSAAITTGHDGVAPTAGQVATARDKDGNIVWRSNRTQVDYITNRFEFIDGSRDSFTKVDCNELALVFLIWTLDPSDPKTPVRGVRFTIRNVGSKDVYLCNNGPYTVNGVHYSSFYDNGGGPIVTDSYENFLIAPGKSYNFVMYSYGEYYTF